MTVEAILSVAGMLFVIPKYGHIRSGVGEFDSHDSESRSVYGVAALQGHRLQLPGSTSRGIYLRPFLIAIPTLLAGYWMRTHWLPGTNWPQAAYRDGIGGYFVLCDGIFCVPREGTSETFL